MNTITVNFTPCIPPPAGGFKVRYRLVGATDFIEIGPFTSSPIIFEAEGDPGAAYEGTLFSDCGGGKIGDEIPWTVGGGASGESSFVPPDFNYVLQAAFNWSIDEVQATGAPTLPPTGTNGSQSGTHTGINDDVFVTISGSLVLPTKLEIYINEIPTFCQQITVGGVYIFPAVVCPSNQNFKVTITLGTC